LLVHGINKRGVLLRPVPFASTQPSFFRLNTFSTLVINSCGLKGLAI
jgi:hypothetical protein